MEYTIYRIQYLICLKPLAYKTLHANFNNAMKEKSINKVLRFSKIENIENCDIFEYNKNIYNIIIL